MAIIEKQKLLALYGSEETAKEIILMFVKKSGQLIKEIEHSLDLNDQDMINKICHKGIGQSRYIAAPELEKTLQSIQTEASSRQDHLEHLKTIIQEIEDAYA
ncbi:Hpt domain-containing protein [Candidatus Synchoanobacter obligatus]|uniref:Hpt domain-containing protein n=1 Tax=Candidatus Synchoanobacter obligatus TaxID=2919597 RepID=A0ABT1L649_9GAMM|nr:Hpt domain-containing protein [Candidatus Synchoanobacter obligatus]MCP8352564.1 Hpt domain-containing protein [Candidatus Synchoanobacter obligatus]